MTSIIAMRHFVEVFKPKEGTNESVIFSLYTVYVNAPAIVAPSPHPQKMVLQTAQATNRHLAVPWLALLLLLLSPTSSAAGRPCSAVAP